MAEKRFPPTARKLRRAREEGDVAKSSQFTGAFMLLGWMIGVSCSFTEFRNLLEFFSITLDSGGDFSPENMVKCWQRTVSIFFCCSWVVLFSVFVSIIFSEVLQVGIRVSFQPLLFRLSRLNFFTGLKRLSGVSKNHEGGIFAVPFLYPVCRLVFAFLLGSLSVGCLFSFFCPGILRASFDGLEEVVRVGYRGSLYLCLAIGSVHLVLGISELWIERFRRKCRLRMDAEEFKRELRDNEGNSEIRAMQKHLQQEILLQDLIQGVRKAKVVIVA